MSEYQDLLMNEYAKQYATNWYKFDEGSGATLNDSKGTAIGTISGATWLQGGGLSFDGVNDFIQFNNRYSSAQNTYVINLSNFYPITTEKTFLTNQSNGTTANGFRLIVRNGKIGLAVANGTSYVVSQEIEIDEEDILLFLYISSSRVRMSLNTISNIVTDDVVNFVYNPSANMRIGNVGGTGSNYFKGNVMYFQYYNDDLLKLSINKSLILHDGEYKKNVSELKQHPIDKYTSIDTLIFKDNASNNQIVGVNGSKINVVNGVVTSSDGVNRLDNSLYFNGTSSIHLDSPLLPIGDKTVDFYFRTTMTGVGTFFSTADGSSSTNGFLINISSGKINMAMKTNGTSWNLSSLGSINSFNDGKWHNARLVFKNGSYIRMYVDGSLEHNTNHSLIETAQGYNLSLGARAGSNTTQGSPPTQFVGNIANFRVYNTVIIDDIPPLIESFYWNTVSSTLPTSTQFIEQGMDNLSPLFDRTVTALEPMSMTDKSEILGVGEIGKVFSKTVDLKKYFDIRSIGTEVKSRNGYI